MKNTNAERQKRYRERTLKDPTGPRLKRLQTMISEEADNCLTQISNETGKTKRDVIEEAIMAMHNRYSITPAVEINEAFWENLTIGFRGHNTPERIRTMFQYLMEVKPTTTANMRREMSVALKEKNVALRFFKKSMNRMADANLIEWNGDMGGTITWREVKHAV